MDNPQQSINIKSQTDLTRLYANLEAYIGSRFYYNFSSTNNCICIAIVGDKVYYRECYSEYNLTKVPSTKIETMSIYEFENVIYGI